MIEPEPLQRITSLGEHMGHATAIIVTRLETGCHYG